MSCAVLPWCLKRQNPYAYRGRARCAAHALHAYLTQTSVTLMINGLRK